MQRKKRRDENYDRARLPGLIEESTGRLAQVARMPVHFWNDASNHFLAGASLIRQQSDEIAARDELIADLHDALENLNNTLDTYWNDYTQAGHRPSRSYQRQITSAQQQCLGPARRAEAMKNEQKDAA